VAPRIIVLDGDQTGQEPSTTEFTDEVIARVRAKLEA
jgi:hypothetical protein